MKTKKTVIEDSEDDDDDLLDNSRGGQVAHRLQKELDQDVADTLSLLDILPASKVAPKKRKTPANNVSLTQGSKCLILTYRNNPGLQLQLQISTLQAHRLYISKIHTSVTTLGYQPPASTNNKDLLRFSSLSLSIPSSLKDKTYLASNGLILPIPSGGVIRKC